MISLFVQRTEEEANKALAKNPTSLDVPREIYKKALEAKILDTKRCSSVRERTGYEEEIRELYISRAAMEIQMGQKKQANLVFEEAMKLDFCRRDPVFWKAYINFFIRIGKYERARKLFKKSLEHVDHNSEQQIWDYWVKFERSMGRNSLTVEELKREVKHTTPPSTGNSSVSNIFQILTCNGTVDVNAMSEVSERDINREHRQMALFQEPPPDIHKIDAREEAPVIDNRILYYLAVVLTDPQVIEMVDLMRDMQYSLMEELDLSQQRCFDELYRKYKLYDLSKEEMMAKCEQKMQGQYSNEEQRMKKLIEDFQDWLHDAGVPGFAKTQARAELKAQRHLIVLMQMISQFYKEEKEKGTL